MVKVLRWPSYVSEGNITHIPVHPHEQICMVGRAPDQAHDTRAFSIWTTDNLHSDLDRSSTGWIRSFVVVLTGEDTPEYFDIWRGSWAVGTYVFHLFEKRQEVRNI